MTETTATPTTTTTTTEIGPRRMSAGTIVWALMVLAFAGLAFVFFTTETVDLTPSVVLSFAVIGGAVLVGIGILGAIVKAITNRSSSS